MFTNFSGNSSCILIKYVGTDIYKCMQFGWELIDFKGTDVPWWRYLAFCVDAKYQDFLFTFYNYVLTDISLTYDKYIIKVISPLPFSFIFLL